MRAPWIWAVLVPAIAGCNAISGVNDYHFASGGGGTSGQGGFVSTSQSGGGGANIECDSENKACGSACVPLSDPDYGCGASTCEPCPIENASAICIGGECQLAFCEEPFLDCDKTGGCEVDPASDADHCGSCDNACASGFSCCGGACQNLDVDPLACGACDATTCGADQWCEGGACACRPGFVLADGSCADLDSDPLNCGAPGASCPVTCYHGTCVMGCPGGYANCGDACVQLSSHPLHCGSCDKACDTNQLCAAGICVQWSPSPGECANTMIPCKYPNTLVDICVDAPVCP